MNIEKIKNITVTKACFESALQNLEIYSFSKSSLNRKYETIKEYEVAKHIPSDMYFIKLIFRIREFKELEDHFLETLKDDNYEIKSFISREIWDRVPSDMKTWETELNKIENAKSKLLMNINEKYDETEHLNFIRYQSLLLENLSLKKTINEHKIFNSL